MGATSRAICRLEETAISTLSAILFCPANWTATRCSAAFPMMGMRMMPRKNSETSQPGDNRLNHSDQHFGEPDDPGGGEHQNDNGCCHGPFRQDGGRSGFLGDRCVARPGSVQQTEDVEDDHDGSHAQAEGFDFWAGFRSDGMAEERRDEHGQHGQHQQDGIAAGVASVEDLASVLDAADHERETHHQQEIAEDRTGNGGLDQFQQAGADGDDGDDEFGSVAEGGIEQAADARTGEVRQGSRWLCRCKRPSG